MTSFDLQEASCRLCLEIILDKNFEVIDDLTKYSVLLKLKFEVGSKHIICSYCWEKLNAAFEFKSTCLNSDNTIIPYVDNEIQLDLREIYLKEKKNEQLTGISIDEKVCRLCMQLVKTNYKHIHDEEFATIQKFVPEMKINIVKDPVVCIQCFDSLSSHSNFLETRFPIEEKICDASAAESERNNALSLDLFVKKEGLDKEWKINDTEMSLKVEPIDIKLENEEERETSFPGEELVDGEIAGRDSPNMYGSKQKKLFNLQMYECGMSDVVKNSHLQHDKGFSEMQVYESDALDFSTHKSILKNHELKHNHLPQVQMYKCDICNYETNCKDTLLCHDLIHRDVSEVRVYTCDICDYKTKYKGNLIKHQIKHKDISEVQVYKCDACDYRAKHKSNLKQHQMKHKDFSKVPIYMCDVCNYKSILKDALICHELTHKEFSEVQVYKCDACDYKTKYKGNLTKHQMKHKDISEVQMYKCDACDYRAKHKTNLKRHQMKHKDISEVQMYKCDACDFKTYLKDTFIRHQLTHKNFSEVQMYKCDACDFRTKRKAYLTEHQLKHKDISEVQLYNCDTCDFKTKYKSSLTKHQERHKDFLEVPMYKCDACDYKVKRKDYLIKHQLKHKNFTQKQMYKCDTKHKDD